MSGHHIVTPSTYLKVLIALMVLMGLTIYAYTIHINPFMNLIIALAIAFTKVTLITMFFMHVKYGSKLTRVFAGAGFFWMVIFITLLLADYMARYYSDSPFVPNPYGG